MKDLKKRIQQLEDQGLLRVHFVNSAKECNIFSGNVCGESTSTTVTSQSLCEVPATTMHRAELLIYTDDTIDTIEDRLEDVAQHIEDYKDFVTHRAGSPNLAEALYYSFKKDKHDITFD